MKKHIPNTITSCNLIAGCIATYFAFQADFTTALLFIVIGAVFDFFDGFAARLLHVSSPIGKELDSLADDITFGFAPAAIVYSMLRKTLMANSFTACPLAAYGITDYVPFVAFIMAAFSALRLAKFNLDERQATSFIGLPTPANALFWSSISLTLTNYGWLDEPVFWLPFAILLGSLLSCWLLIAEIPMFALKFKTYGFKGNELRYSFVACSIVLIASFGWNSLAAIIVFYILTSIVSNLFGTKIVDEE